MKKFDHKNPKHHILVVSVLFLAMLLSGLLIKINNKVLAQGATIVDHGTISIDDLAGPLSGTTLASPYYNPFVSNNPTLYAGSTLTVRGRIIGGKSTDTVSQHCPANYQTGPAFDYYISHALTMADDTYYIKDTGGSHITTHITQTQGGGDSHPCPDQNNNNVTTDITYYSYSFQYSFSTAGMSPGTHTTTITTRAADGTYISTSKQFTIASPASSLTATAYTCTILFHSVICGISPDLTWGVSNPEVSGGTAITSDTNESGNSQNNFIISPPPTVGTADEGKLVTSTVYPVSFPFVVYYPGRNFFLYNNAKSLYPTSPNGAGIRVNAVCEPGTNWGLRTGMWQTNPPSYWCRKTQGTLTSSTCTIAEGQTSCNVTLTWNVTDPDVVNGSSITSSTNNSGATSANFVITPPVSTGTNDSGTKTNVVIPFLNGGYHVGRVFYLYNNSKSLVPETTNGTGAGISVSAECGNGLNWLADSNGVFACRVGTPPSPLTLTAACPKPGNYARFTWTLPTGYTHALLRVIDDGTSPKSPPWSASNKPSILDPNMIVRYPNGQYDTLPSDSPPVYTPHTPTNGELTNAPTPSHYYTAWLYTRSLDYSSISTNPIFTTFYCPQPNGVCSSPANHLQPCYTGQASSISSNYLKWSWTCMGPDTQKTSDDMKCSELKKKPLYKDK